MKSVKPGTYTSVDWSYVLMVLVSVAVGGTAACSVLREQELVAIFLENDLLEIYSDIGVGLLPIAAFLMVWRIWMAACYRAVAPVSNRKLPVVTIVIPAYNEGRQVLETIRSVMASNYPANKLRVVCVDDGSRDDTWQWLCRGAKEFPSIRLLRQPRNMGKRHAVLAGLRGAEGSVYVTLDSDSEILADTLRHLVSPFVRSPKVGAVAGNVRVLNIDEGPIPKMLDVSFTMSFDFFRRAQSTYGGVLCTPGALSAYRASVVASELDAWAEQTFLGRPANIGEDRALTNIVLRQGFRVVYQKEAIVLTKVPTAYGGLRRMLLRWARSNVRECLVMVQFLFTPFRRGDGVWWVRLGGTLELVLLPLVEAMKVGVFLNLLLHPMWMLNVLAIGCLVGAAMPTIIYQLRRPCISGGVWALAYASFWVFGLSWISFWGLYSAARSGWLTRNIVGVAPRLSPALPVEKHSEAA